MEEIPNKFFTERFFVATLAFPGQQKIDNASKARLAFYLNS